jgi:hypothetical protein
MFDEGVGSQDTIGASQTSGFVEVMFARTVDEAQECCVLLNAQDIDARIEGIQRPGRSGGIAVLVPDDRFIEASEFLAVNLQDVTDDEDEVEDEEEMDDADDDDDDDLDDLDDDDDDYPDDDDEEDTGTDDDV